MRINLADGSTLTFDLDDEDDRAAWHEFVRSQDPEITAAVVGNGRHPVAVTAPARFRNVRYSVERSGEDDDGQALAERVEVQADGVRLVVLRYRSGTTRIGLTRTGIPRYLPDTD